MITKLCYFALVTIVLVGCYFAFFPFYFSLMLGKYEGDGTIQDISSRLFIFPLSGYSITFDSFDLSCSFNKSYLLKKLPNNEEIDFYLTIEDPKGLYLNQNDIVKFKAKVKIVIKTDDGDLVNGFEGMTNDMIWWSSLSSKGIPTHRLYSSNPTTLVDSDSNRNYSVSIEYTPIEIPENLHGYLYMQWGGVK